MRKIRSYLYSALHIGETFWRFIGSPFPAFAYFVRFRLFYFLPLKSKIYYDSHQKRRTFVLYIVYKNQSEATVLQCILSAYNQAYPIKYIYFVSDDEVINTTVKQLFPLVTIVHSKRFTVVHLKAMLIVTKADFYAIIPANVVYSSNVTETTVECMSNKKYSGICHTLQSQILHAHCPVITCIFRPQALLKVGIEQTGELFIPNMSLVRGPGVCVLL